MRFSDAAVESRAVFARLANETSTLEPHVARRRGETHQHDTTGTESDEVTPRREPHTLKYDARAVD